MRIVSWNCNGALRNKTHRIDQLAADILIIQECEDPKYHSEEFIKWSGDYLWKGSSRHKGIGVFARNGIKIEGLDWSGSFFVKGFRKNHPAHHWSSEELEHFLPFSIDQKFNVLAVWTKNANVYKYIGQLWQYMQIHYQQIISSPILIMGDLNSNKRWDREGRWWNHSDVVSELNEEGIISLYHHCYSESQGEESLPTFYLQRNTEKAFHIDFVFGSREFQTTSMVTIGCKDDWLDISDHMPVILDT